MKPDPSTNPHLAPERLAREPLVLERGLSVTQLRRKLDSIREYRDTQIKQGQPHHALTVRQLEVMLAKSGYSYKLAQGVGRELPKSVFLEKISVN